MREFILGTGAHPLRKEHCPFCLEVFGTGERLKLIPIPREDGERTVAGLPAHTGCIDKAQEDCCFPVRI